MAAPIIKICTTCNKPLPLEAFKNAKKGKHGKESVCRECRKAYMKEYHQRPEVKEYERLYHAEAYRSPEYRKRQYLNAQKPELRARKLTYLAKYREDNKDQLAAYMVEYCKGEGAQQLRKEASKRYEDKYLLKHGETRATVKSRKYNHSLMGNINKRMSRRMHHAIARKKERRSWREYVDFSVDELMKHLELHFSPGMSWWNRGEWHIDHIRPIASFNFESTGDPAFKECWALENLQPLWAIDNIRKSDKWEVA